MRHFLCPVDRWCILLTPCDDASTGLAQSQGPPTDAETQPRPRLFCGAGEEKQQASTGNASRVRETKTLDTPRQRERGKGGSPDVEHSRMKKRRKHRSKKKRSSPISGRKLDWMSLKPYVIESGHARDYGFETRLSVVRMS